MVNNDLPLLWSATEATWMRPRVAAAEFMANCIARLQGCMPRVLVVGVGFKPAQRVIDCCPGVAFAKELHDRDCRSLVFYDPLVEQSQLP